MKLKQDQINKLAHLAKLNLSEQEIKNYQKQLDDILVYVEKINKLDLDKVEESLTGVGEEVAKPRPDEAKESQANIIKQAAKREDNYMVSPGVFEK